jgi:hypothetical protein
LGAPGEKDSIDAEVPMIHALLAAVVLAQGKKIEWKKDFEAALKDAQKSGKYVVLHFTGPN